MNRQLNLNNLQLERDKNIISRLLHNKNADTSKTRIRNSITKATEQAQEYLKQGKLKPVVPVKALIYPQQIKDYIKAIQENGIYVLDFETTGLNIWNDIIVGVALYTPNQQPVYIPINHTDLQGNILDKQIEEDKARKLLTPLFKDKEVKAILHNGKFDDKILFGNWGIRIANIYWDTMIAQHILNENENKGLKEVYQRYINREDTGLDYGDLFGNNTPFNFIPLDIATIYGANDGIKTYQLYQFQKRWLNPKHRHKEFSQLYKVFNDIEMKLLPVVTDMELRGVELDTKYYKELEKELAQSVQTIEHKLDKVVLGYRNEILANKELKRLTKETGKINYNSPAQVQRLLYDIWRLPSIDRRTPRGTGEPIIKQLVAKVNDKQVKEFLTLFLQYKEERKILTSFIKKLPLEVERKTNAIHSQFNQVGTVTGRFASRNPNLQQIPSRGEWGSKVRQGFKARDGYIFLGSDYSQIEPRTLASLVYKKTGGKAMYEAYENEKDLYVMMASKIYKLPESECREFDEEGNFQEEGNFRRDSVKSVLLGIMYERGSYAIAEQFGKPAKWGDEIVKLFLESFPHVEEYRRYLVYHAEKLGYVQTITGRKRRLPDMQIKNKNDGRYKNAHRQVLNATIQGSAGDILKLAMIEVGNNRSLEELDAHMVLTIHDEIIVEVPKEHQKEAGEILAGTMKEAGYKMLGIPMKCDVEVMERWGE